MTPTDTSIFCGADFKASLFITVIVLSLGLMGFLVKSWINSVNKRLDILFDLMSEMSKKREDRWERQDELCRKQEGRIAKLEGKAYDK